VARSASLSVVVADTGALYALIDAADSWHARVIAWWRSNTKPVVVPVTVLPEVTYLLHSRIGPAAEEAFVQAVADGEFTVASLEDGDLENALELMRRHEDFPLGFVDATVAAIAERLQTREIVTTDRPHFGIIRPRHAKAFVLLP
jgi:uncharacterized protein